jgi:hypothetical protein
VSEGGSKRSLITFAIKAVQGPSSAPGELPTPEARRKALMMSYLWPVTCCGIFLPALAYAQYRHDDDLGPHARHGVVLSGVYTAAMVGLGLINGIVGRIADDWSTVSVAVGIVTAVLVALLTGFGYRWFTAGMAGRSVDIPIVSSLADKL